MLIEERQTVELGARNGHLEVITGPRAVLYLELGRIRECLREKRADRICLQRRSW